MAEQDALLVSTTTNQQLILGRFAKCLARRTKRGTFRLPVKSSDNNVSSLSVHCDECLKRNSYLLCRINEPNNDIDVKAWVLRHQGREGLVEWTARSFPAHRINKLDPHSAAGPQQGRSLGEHVFEFRLPSDDTLAVVGSNIDAHSKWCPLCVVGVGVGVDSCR